MSSPIIVVGMHRSGTSLVTRLLARLGLFIGWGQNRHAESTYFLARNRWLLEALGARWDAPPSAGQPLAAGRAAALADRLRAAVSSPSIIAYVGPSRYLRWRSLHDLRIPWGWKDPRTSLVLPLWLEVFPAARVVHVIRNGVDVALSLKRREEKRLAGFPSSGARVRASVAAATLVPPDGVSRSGWAWHQIQARVSPAARRDRPARATPHPSLDLRSGFELWTQYLSRVDEAAKSIDDGVFEIRFEDLLTDPVAEIERLAAYCRLPVHAGQAKAAATIIDKGARHRFREDAEGRALFDAVRNNAWMLRGSY